MRPVQFISLVVFGALLAAVSICSPDTLAKNRFLDEFVNHGYIIVLAVIVTVSLVLVAQIHLEYSRTERHFGVRVFGPARSTINIGASILTSMLLLAFLVPFVRAEVAADPVKLSLAYGVALMTLKAAVFIMYDLVRTVYVLAAEGLIGEDGSKDGGSSDTTSSTS